MPTCSLGSRNTGAGTNFSWLRRPNRPSSSSQAAIGFRRPGRAGTAREPEASDPSSYIVVPYGRDSEASAASATAVRHSSSLLA